MRCSLRRMVPIVTLSRASLLVKAWFVLFLGSMTIAVTDYGPEPPRGLLYALEECMSIDDQEIISAQVILASASDKRADGQTAITSENIQDFQPTTETAAVVRRAFAAAGFDVGPMMGNSFSITAPVGAFQKFFKTRLGRTARSGIQSIREDGSVSEELPLENLPEAITRHVVAVTFTPPPDFGPGGRF